MGNTDQDWDLIIKPRRNLLDINISEIWHYRDLIFLFVRRDFVSTYKQTILGPLWFIINPIFSTIVFTVIFGKIAGISTDGLPQTVFYMSGIVGWNYFAIVLQGTSNSFISNAGIFGKVYFPRLTVPLSMVFSGLIRFGIQFFILLLLIGYYVYIGFEFQTSWLVLLIPFYILILAILGMGCGIIISSLTTKYRDLSKFLGFGIQLWMYATPVIYPVSTLPEKFKPLILANPVAPILELFKYSLLGAGTVELGRIIYSVIFAIVILLIGIMIFNKVEKNFMDTV